nr:ABC transporter permease [uncultured Sellimonas sp.]
MITKEMLSKRFWQEIRLKIQILLLLCITFMISALLSFINFSTTGIWDRKQVFQTMRSIGMTKREVRRMVLLENLIIAFFTAIFSFLFAYLLAGVGARIYMMPQYYSEFTLSLRPLWILIPIVFLTAIWTAVAALRKTED